MSTRTTTVVLATLGLLAPLGSTAAAHPQLDDAGGWYLYEDTFTHAAGEVCSGEVIENYRTKERVLVEDEGGDLAPLSAEEAASFDPTTLELGDRWAVEVKWGWVRWHAPSTDERERRDTSGDMYFRVVGDGNDWAFKGFGNNFFVGPGVSGILSTTGFQRGVVEDVDDAVGGTLTWLKVKGEREQICFDLGLRPVEHDADD
ncbi:hypothetical protein G6553_08550 [Nocardioides sp. IC4_145]|uniref:hypothetical protein n=1 Tax=Nocardioides sp. IC4_145 TaxID=2714037 RepID=UPI00140D7345|nr:hypothetical protein [Nocardioides sp. IC4_145]NHC23219.1 hypothetical protein [Nocardioides sp. IC4_145]